jgi:hypothetical protein
MKDRTTRISTALLTFAFALTTAASAQWTPTATFTSSDGSSGWSQSVLYSFLGGSDGLTPSASLIMDAAGNLYSTTPYGGKTSSTCSIGCGVVFELPGAASGVK